MAKRTAPRIDCQIMLALEHMRPGDRIGDTTVAGAAAFIAECRFFGTLEQPWVIARLETLASQLVRS